MLPEFSDMCVCVCVCVCVYVRTHAYLCSSLCTGILNWGYRGQLAVQHTYSSVLCVLDHLIRFRFLPATLSGENIVISYKCLK